MPTVTGVASSLRKIAYSLSSVIAVTSLIDLFINRLLFRAGPEVLTHLSIDPFYLAVVGRVSITLEQLLLFVVLSAATVVLFLEGEVVSLILGSLLAAVVAFSAISYLPLPADQSWAASSLLVLSVASVIAGLSWFRVSELRHLPTRKRLVHAGFLFCLVLSFLFPLYYRMYLVLGGARVASLPLPLEAYEAGIFFVMATAIAALVYALSATTKGFKPTFRSLALVTILPTLVVAPILYGVMRSFFVAQILTLVVAMSTDFVLSHDLLTGIIISWWFYLAAIVVLFLKAHHRETRLRQEAIGLVLIMSTSFLFNYPYYLMLGTLGMLLLCQPFAISREAHLSQ